MSIFGPKKSSDVSGLMVVDWSPGGAMLIQMEPGTSTRIKRFSYVQTDPNMTDAEKRNAYLQFLNDSKKKTGVRSVVTWSDGITFRQLVIPEMPPDDLMKAFIWDLKKKFYYEAEDNLFGHQPVMNVETEEGTQKLHNVFYCENKTALPRLSFMTSLGLELESLVPSQAALAKFCSLQTTVKDKDSLICDLSENVARMIVVRDQTSMLARNVTLNVVDGVWTDEVLGRLAEEIHKTQDYYEGQRYASPVGQVIFTGSGPETMRLLDFMSSKLTTPVTVPNLDNYLSASIPEADKNFAVTHTGLFAGALGAALMADPTINLLPADIKTKNQQRKLRGVLNLGLFGFGLVLAAFAGVSAMNVQWMKAQLDVHKKKYDEVNQRKDDLQKMLSESKIRRAARAGNIPTRALLKDLSLRTPSLAVLREILYSRQDNSLLIQGDVLEAKRESSKTVSQFVSSLSESPFIESATIVNTNQNEENKTLQFEISCVVKGFS